MSVPTQTATDRRIERLISPFSEHYTEAYSYISHNGSVPRRFIILIRKGPHPARRIMAYARYVYAHYLWEKDQSSIPEGMEVDHKNDKSLDDDIHNLQLLTRLQNLEKRKNRTFKKIVVTPYRLLRGSGDPQRNGIPSYRQYQTHRTQS